MIHGERDRRRYAAPGEEADVSDIDSYPGLGDDGEPVEVEVGDDELDPVASVTPDDDGVEVDDDAEPADIGSEHEDPE